MLSSVYSELASWHLCRFGRIWILKHHFTYWRIDSPHEYGCPLVMDPFCFSSKRPMVVVRDTSRIAASSVQRSFATPTICVFLCLGATALRNCFSIILYLAGNFMQGYHYLPSAARCIFFQAQPSDSRPSVFQVSKLCTFVLFCSW